MLFQVGGYSLQSPVAGKRGLNSTKFGCSISGWFRVFELRTSVILFRVLACRTDRARIAVGRNSSSRHVRMWEFGLSRGLDAESEREREREREVGFSQTS